MTPLKARCDDALSLKNAGEAEMVEAAGVDPS
jgi:hypothetical protein